MEKRSKYIWIIIILLVTNLATIGSVWYHLYAEKNAETRQQEPEMPSEQRAHFLVDQLNLDQEQADRFRELNRTFNRKANPITHQLEDLRIEMLDELASDRPDKEKLENIAIEIGKLHTNLKETTIDFYSQMKSVCNQEQQTKLYQIFHSMLHQEEDVRLPRGRHQGGRGRNRSINNN